MSQKLYIYAKVFVYAWQTLSDVFGLSCWTVFKEHISFPLVCHTPLIEMPKCSKFIQFIFEQLRKIFQASFSTDIDKDWLQSLYPSFQLSILSVTVTLERVCPIIQDSTLQVNHNIKVETKTIGIIMIYLMVVLSVLLVNLTEIIIYDWSEPG